MLGFIKALPIVLLIAGLGYGAHSWIVGKLENRRSQSAERSIANSR